LLISVLAEQGLQRINPLTGIQINHKTMPVLPGRGQGENLGRSARGQGQTQADRSPASRLYPDRLEQRVRPQHPRQEGLQSGEGIDCFDVDHQFGRVVVALFGCANGPIEFDGKPRVLRPGPESDGEQASRLRESQIEA